MLFALVPMLVSMLGTFLWATPVVSAELERKSWVYLAVRPHGKVNVLIGKYLVAITWALSAALAGLCAAVAIMPADDGAAELAGSSAESRCSRAPRMRRFICCSALCFPSARW